MTQNMLTIPQNFAGSLPTAFQGVGGADDLAAGITGGFGIVTYKGKVWRTKYRGEETILMDNTGRNPRHELEVIIVKAAQAISKVFYKSGYVEGSNSPPDCWSVNGLTPDPAAPDKQNPLCASCKQNAWGSRVSEAGKAGKACSDNKRLVIVPADDILNESLGGPMMLRVPPASLQDMATFGKMMESKGFPYFALVTRLRFDANEAYPRFIFEPVRPLTNDEAKLVIELRSNPITQRILDAPVVEVQHDTDANQPDVSLPPAADLFTPQAAAQAAQMAAAVTGQPTPVVQPTQTVTQPVAQQTTAVPQNVVPPVRPKFDPMTGQPIIYADEFPEMPQQLARQPEPVKQQVQPVVAQPTVVEQPKNDSLPSFDEALNNLLGGPKK
jgi:hypothetical protein